MSAERKGERKAREGRPARKPNIDKGRETILARARERMQAPGANRGRIMSETLGQLYALTKDEERRAQYRKDINKLG